MTTPSPDPRRYPALSRFLAPPRCDRVDLLREAVGGKTVLLTGASFGIGEALALRLGAAGARVLLVARTAERLASVARVITDAGGRAEVFPFDLADPAQVERAAAEIRKISGGADVVIHNAGKSIRRSVELSLDRAHDFRRCMAVNYLGPVELQLSLLPAMLARGSGHIVNVSSVGVRLPPAPRWAAYQASKSAFDIWIRSVAPELHHKGIVCSSIYLGLVHSRMSAPTPGYRGMPGLTPDEAAQVICGALIRKPRQVAPWWLTPARWFASPLEGAVAYFQTRLFPSGTDSPSAKGERPR